MNSPDWQSHLQRNGFAILKSEFSHEQVDALLDEVEHCISGDFASSIRSRGGSVYAARDLSEVMPAANEIWQTESLIAKLDTVLGSDFGFVRGLYFDKHPDRPWSLPWHKDMTIAVQRNDLPSETFRNPTRKAGVSHVEAPHWLLNQMLTLRIHLDTVTSDNGPLQVIAGSHLENEGDSESQHVPLAKHSIREVLCDRGDVLAMRPLLSHASGVARPDAGHRRIIHLEFAAKENLPDAYRWRNYIRPKLKVA